jgi:glucose-1-phosphate thymidylyltransferase
VILGDNTTDFDITSHVRSFKDGAMVFLKKVADPQRFGVAEFSRPKKGVKPRIVNIIEKPKDPPSDYAVTGFYLYDNTVFKKIKAIKPSERGQLEITDVNNLYLQEGKLGWEELEGFWTDSGTPASLLKANVYWALKKGVNML